MVNFRRYAAEGIHDKVLAYLVGFQRGFVLDVPSGQGILSKELEELGYKVFPGDIEIENIYYKKGRSVQLDLNTPLPFKEGTFDYVVCVEGIEHIENPHGLIREFARLIKKNGYLIVTTPNVMTIKSRLRFLFYSYLDFFKYFGPLPFEEKHRIKDYEHQHINPLFYGEMKFILEKYGFQIDRIETNRKVKKWKTVYPFLKWVIRNQTKKKFKRDSFFISDNLLEGEILIFITKYSGVART